MLPPAIVGYDVLRPLSEGQGVSWLAKGTRGDVVVKVYEEQDAAKGDALVAFASRAGAMAALGHRGVASLVDRGRSGTLMFTVRDHFTRGSLATLATGMSAADKVRVALDLGHALEHAHRRGLPHGAVKPENVLFGASAEPLLVDFSFGPPSTPSPFAAPEQSGAHRLDPRVDQYSFAALVAWLLLGHVPQPGETISERAELDQALKKSLSPSPTDRFGQLEQLLTVVESTTRPSPSGRPEPFSIEVDRSSFAISVRVSGKWTPETVGTCIAKVTQALEAPGAHAIGYLLGAQSGCHSAAIEALAALHARYRDRLKRVGFVSGTPEARGASVLIGRRVEGLPWKTFASADSMTSWLVEANA